MSKYMRAFCAASAVAVTALLSASAALAAPPAEAFGNLPVITEARLSPDGKHLAIIRPLNGRPVVTVYQLDSPTAVPQNAGFPDAIADDIIWANNSRLVCTFRTNLKEKYGSGIYELSRAVSVSVDGGPAVFLMNDTPKDVHWSSGVVDQDPTDTGHVLMEFVETDAQLHGDSPRVYDQNFLDLFRVDLTTGTSDIIAHGSRNTIRYVMDGLGHAIARIDETDDLEDHLLLGGREVASYNVRGGSKWGIDGVTEDGGALAVSAIGNEGIEALYGYKLGDKDLGPPLFLDPNYDVNSVLYDDHENRVIGVSYIADKAEYKYFDPVREKIKERLEHALAGQSISLESRDAAGANYVIAAEGPKSPATYYLFSPATSQLSVVATAYPGLAATDLGEEKPYPYKSRDGFDIRAYLTLPSGKPAKNLPMVVFPHGGPAARDELEFDWWAQFMASRGYAVLQPNFRGSSGYGVAFRDAGNGEWAGKVQNDLEDGVRKLVADGIADPKRICIVGASYGGYAALAGATFRPNLYACAISYAGLADLSLYLDHMANATGNDSVPISVWEARMGASRSETGKLDAISPAAHADQVKIPVLLIHSSKDITVPIEQSEAENKALQSAGKDVQFITLDGDDHYLSLGETRIRLLKEVDRFLAAHIGN